MRNLCLVFAISADMPSCRTNDVPLSSRMAYVSSEGVAPDQWDAHDFSFCESESEADTAAAAHLAVSSLAELIGAQRISCGALWVVPGALGLE